MRQAWQNWKEHTGPDLHLFGINYLMDEGIQVKMLRHKSGSIREASRYGNLNQQTRAAFRGFLYSLVYCVNFGDSRFLSLLRNNHLFGTDLLSVAHSPLDRDAANYQAIKAHWKISMIGKCLHTEALATWPEFKEKFVYIPWGADLGFYPKPGCDPKPEGYILSVGATRRDFNTLVEAARKCDRQFVICTHQESGLAKGNLPKNVLIHEKSFMSYDETFQLYRDCLAVAIPLDLPENYRGTQIGLTSLIEAMAMGKPVVMTQHPLLDIDIQEERLGFWTHPKDVNSWIDAVGKLSSDPKQAAVMGERGRLLCEEKYNTARYGKDLYRLIKEHPSFTA